jgi:hypothetical protein
MKSQSIIALVLAFMISISSAQSWPKTAPASGQSVRVSGTQPAPTQSGDLWKSGNLATESPLPVGYNAPTPQGAIEIKTYPTVRRAELDSSKLLLKGVFGTSRGFWTLFNHIKSRNIAMTAPVEFNFRNEDASRSFLGEFTVDWTMSFLYRKPELGATGTDGSVVVVDKPEISVISVGLEGTFSYTLLNEGVDILRGALDSQKTWVAAGEPRFFAYNSPMTSYKWAEVQIPIKLA